jgi:uncharacterized membrane protein
MTESSLDHDVRSPTADPARSARHRLDDDPWTGLALGAALVAMTLVAGLIYTFSVAVMPNLAGADDRTFVATMQRFNENPVFQLTFTGALVLTVLAAVQQRRHGPGVALRWTVAALVLYGIVFAVTLGINIPLNNEIDQAGDPDRIADLAHVRNRFEGPWVAANIARTLLSTAAVAALARAIFLHGRSTADRKAGRAPRDHHERGPPPPSRPPRPHLRPVADTHIGRGGDARVDLRS